ncbi:MAG TPA: glycine cleavage system protein GcvH [Candidatus Dormibacteraeota bacterium]|nr:glycine cleavage system protein GcvH [Candidatus Dormibacteraeota bacterium]
MPYPTTLRYTRSHEWVEEVPGGGVRIGITDFAQDQLGDIVHVELPAVGRRLAAGEVFGVVESVKTVGDLYAPVAGTVAEVNVALDDAPEVVNGDPHGAGWIVRLEDADLDAGSGELMDAAAYEELIAGSGH